MTQENLFEKDSETVDLSENTVLKAKVIGVGGSGPFAGRWAAFG